MTHDELARDLGEKLGKATLRPLSILVDARPSCSLVHVETGEGCEAGQGVAFFSVNKRLMDEAEAVVEAVNAAPLLLREREALRRVEDAARGYLNALGKIELRDALKALDALRDEEGA